MSRFQKIKNLRKQRLHREGTEILIISALLLLTLNGLVYWGCGLNLLFYIIAAISIVLYLLMVNFFRGISTHKGIDVIDGYLAKQPRPLTLAERRAAKQNNE